MSRFSILISNVWVLWDVIVLYSTVLSGVHVIQQMAVCEWDDETRDIIGYQKYGYDGENEGLRQSHRPYYKGFPWKTPEIFKVLEKLSAENR